MKWILLLAMFGLMGCATRAVVKDCKDIVADYKDCEVVR